MIFAHIDNESSVQANDKTRLDGSKTFSTINETVFNKLWIKPGSDESLINIYNTKVFDRVLDWEFNNFYIDIDSTNNKIDFDETGVTLTATITTGTYSLSTLAIEIKTALEIAGALTYTVSFDADHKLTISSTTSFDLVLDGTNKNNLFISQMFFDIEELTDRSIYTSERTEYLTRKISIIAGENRFQDQDITAVANTSDVLSGKYFFLYSSLDAVIYYVWFDSGASIDPAPSGATGIQVLIASGDSAIVVATAAAVAINALADFVSTSSLAVISVTNATIGWATPAYDINTLFIFSVVTEGQTQVSDVSYIKVYSELGDHLFSSDQDLIDEESDIMKWVPKGKNTFKNVHRRAQEKILEYLDRHGFTDIFENKYTKWAIKDFSEVNEWSRYMTLRMIFEDISNAPADVFKAKRTVYESEEIQARQRAILRLDTDNDGEADPWEGLGKNTMKLGFR